MQYKSDNKIFGDEGERLACDLLISKGYRIVERNFRLGNMGEIDIVARDGGYLVFVEVKTRHSMEYGEPEFALTPMKINQVKKMASAYLAVRGIKETDCRFDVVAILFKKNHTPVINHYENAFS
jgi:putative endonuclease